MKVIGIAPVLAASLAKQYHPGILMKNVLGESHADNVPIWSCYLAVPKYTPPSFKWKQVVIATGEEHNKPCAHLIADLASTWFANGMTEIWIEKKPYTKSTWASEEKAEWKEYAVSCINYSLNKKGYTCKCEASPKIHDTVDIKDATWTPVTPVSVVKSPPPKSHQHAWTDYLIDKEKGKVPQGDGGIISRTTPRRDIYTAICSFYVLNEIRVGASLVTPKRRESHGGIAEHLFRRELTEYIADFSLRLGQNLFDYMVCASIGEARHSHVDLGIGHPEGRHEHYAKAHRYDPRDITAVSKWVFKHHLGSWPSGGGYGGPKWYKIAETAEEYMLHEYYWKHPDVFVDHCVDLAHNGGLMFNKGYIFNMPGCGESEYMRFLDHKRNHPLSTWKGPLSINFEVHDLLCAARAHGFFPGVISGRIVPANDPVIPTIKWGMKPVFGGEPQPTPNAQFTMEVPQHAMPDVPSSNNGKNVETYFSREEAGV